MTGRTAIRSRTSYQARDYLPSVLDVPHPDCRDLSRLSGGGKMRVSVDNPLFVAGVLCLACAPWSWTDDGIRWSSRCWLPSGSGG